MINSNDAQLLQRLAGERDIRNLIARLGHLADDGDIDDYLDMWTEDSSWIHEGGKYTGREARRARVEAHRADGIQGPGTNSRHVNTTLWVTFDDDHNARAESYYLYIRDAGGSSPQLALTGRYYDRFRLTTDGWKFAERRIVRDIN